MTSTCRRHSPRPSSTLEPKAERLEVGTKEDGVRLVVHDAPHTFVYGADVHCLEGGGSAALAAL
jgi:hypothetical protein